MNLDTRFVNVWVRVLNECTAIRCTKRLLICSHSRTDSIRTRQCYPSCRAKFFNHPSAFRKALAKDGHSTVCPPGPSFDTSVHHNGISTLEYYSGIVGSSRSMRKSYANVACGPVCYPVPGPQGIDHGNRGAMLFPRGSEYVANIFPETALRCTGTRRLAPSILATFCSTPDIQYHFLVDLGGEEDVDAASN